MRSFLLLAASAWLIAASMSESEEECPSTPPDPFNIERDNFERTDEALDASSSDFVCFRIIRNASDFHRRLDEAIARKKFSVQKIGQHRIFTLFFASPDKNGKFWCPDCQRAVPIVRKSLPHIQSNSTFLIVYVGERQIWKNANNEFRTDPDVRLSAIPTLIEWGTHKKLVEADLFEEEHVIDFIKSEDESL